MLVLGLQTKLGDGNWDETILLRRQPVPAGQHVERGHHQGKVGLEIRLKLMPHLLHVAHHGEHGKDGLDQHPLVALPATAYFQVGRVALLGVESGIAEDHAMAFEGFHQRAADDPPVVGNALGRPLLPVAPIAHRMDQFDAVGIDHAEQAGLGEEQQSPLPLVAQPPEQAGALRQAREAVGEVPFQPAVEGLLAHVLDGEEYADGDDLAGPKRRLAVVGDVFHAVVYPAEQISDKVFGGHGVVSPLDKRF